MFSTLNPPIATLFICEADLIRGLILARTSNTLRVAVQGADDLADLYLVGDRWMLAYPSELPDNELAA